MIVFIVMIIIYPVSKIFFANIKDRSIFVISSLAGNTANLGVPVCIAIFGETSVIYTTIINLANVFFVFIIGVYFYSRGNFSPKDSFLNVLKLPVLWVAFLAILFNINNISIPKSISSSLQMGAYASIVLQLVLFGIYLKTVKIKKIDKKLMFFVSGVKFIFLPFVAAMVLYFLPISNFAKGVLFIELSMPLAVANTNFAALYECRPKIVTAIVFFTSILFLGTIFIDLIILDQLKWIS